MLPLLSWLVAAAPVCPAPPGPVLVVVTSADPRLRSEAPGVERKVRRAIGDRMSLLPAAAAARALTDEGGAARRAEAVTRARVKLARAFERFRELEDAAALSLVAEVTAGLSAVSQSPGAIALMAEAHLLAGAVFVARGRVDAAHIRLRRALQLSPGIAAPADRYAPRVRAELAALRGDPGPAGQLTVDLVEALDDDATVYVDGRRRGNAPLVVDQLPEGRHLIRVSAPGRLSFHTTVRVRAGRTARVRARLVPDPEVRQIDDVARWLGDDQARRSTMALLKRRTEATAVLLVELRMDDRRSATATATRAVVLRLDDDRPPQTATLDAGALRRGVGELLGCRSGREPPTLAPALTRWPTPEFAPTKYTPGPGWWSEPWVWALFAVALVGTAGALTAIRNAQGPPNEVEITLVPRP